MDNEEVVGEVVDPTNLEPEEPEAPPEETPKEEPKAHEPPPEHPRFKEIYGKMREFERQLNEKDETLSAVIDHNKSLQDSLDGIYDKISVNERPDPITDPEAHDQWLIERAKREMKREQKPPETQKRTPPNKVAEQAAIMKSMFPDFDQVVMFAADVIDAETKSEIGFSDNPPRKLYEYGLKKKAEISQQRSNNLKQAKVEGGGSPPPDKKTIVLTPQQERIRMGLGVSKENYIKQLEFIEKGRG